MVGSTIVVTAAAALVFTGLDEISAEGALRYAAGVVVRE